MKEVYKRVSLFTGTYLMPLPDLHECTELYQNTSELVKVYQNNELYWHERVAFQRSAFGRSTAGNDVVAISPFF